MEDARIREILGLNDDVEITEDHRGQALQKLDEQVQELTPVVAAVTEATGTEDLSEAATALTEGKLPGKVVLAEADHISLTADREELKTLKAGQEGTVTLTAAKAQELEEGAKAGKESEKKLAEMQADTAISDAIHKDHRQLNDVAKEIARKALVEDYDEGLKLLTSYPAMSEEMLKASGDSGEGPKSGDAVKAFIDEKTADGKMTTGQAMGLARKLFTAAQIEAYAFQPVAA